MTNDVAVGPDLYGLLSPRKSNKALQHRHHLLSGDHRSHLESARTGATNPMRQTNPIFVGQASPDIESKVRHAEEADAAAADEGQGRAVGLWGMPHLISKSRSGMLRKLMEQPPMKGRSGSKGSRANRISALNWIVCSRMCISGVTSRRLNLPARLHAWLLPRKQIT